MAYAHRRRLLQASEGARVGAELPRRSLLLDALVALVFLGLGLVLLKVFARAARPDDGVFVVLISLPLVIRRRRPRTALLLVVAVALAQLLLARPVGFHDAALLFALYTAVGCTDRRFGLTSLALALLVVALGAVTGWWSYLDRQLAAPHWWVRPLTTGGLAILVLACWALGERLRSARLGSIALAERAGQLEREREQQARLAAAAERARIAREMHDVVAHGLSVIIVQADGAAYVVEQSPAVAREALEQISATGRQSLAEMRNLLGLLRAGDGSESGGLPQPDLDDLSALVDQARAGGADVELSQADALGAIPAMVSLTAYRIVQEALTNARRHGGPTVRVRVERDGRGLRVQVADAGGADSGHAASEPPGHGLIGVRERVAAVGGNVTAGPGPAGGFVVDAWLPVDDPSTKGRT